MTALVLVSAVALCTGTLVFALTCFVTGPTSWPPFGLTSGTGFTITSTISSSSTSQVAAVLYPGANRYLWYTAHNPLTVPITVTYLSIATATSQSPAGCPISNLDYGQTTFSGTPMLVVPGRVGATDGTNSVPVPISLYDTNKNQDRCEGVRFNFVYTGTAHYTDTTTTALTSSPNPSAAGSLVTFTATVVPTVTPPSNPTGTVDFYTCSTATCSSKTPFGSGSLGADGVARYSTSSLAAGTYTIEAIYQGAPTDFSGSTSNTVAQVITAPIATTTVLTSTPSSSVFGGTVVFTATVARSSGTGTPTGTVNFYTCSTVGCTPTKLLGSGTLKSGKVTFSTSILPVGTTYVEAVYQGVPGSFSTSTSNVVTQVVTVVATTTVLTASPNPSVFGNAVTLTATVTTASGSGTPTGTMSFYSCTTAACTNTNKSPLGTGTLNASAKATFVTSSLSVGTDSLYAVYSGDTNFETSTSPVISQVVVSLPSRCTSNYTNWFFGNPASPNITGTNGNDFIYAFGGNFRVTDFNGDDCCFYGGGGNNWLSDGNGNDVAIAGDGNNVFDLGNGNDQITVGNGTNTIGAGNGSDSVTVGNGSHNGITLGWGTDSVTVGSGSYNGVALGSGTDSVTIEGGSYDTVNGGAGNETIYLGAGTHNTYNGAAHHTNICHLPTGKTAASLQDTITNCTVVTP
jgi:Ca2+-binding RTX toxin-like protein